MVTGLKAVGVPPFMGHRYTWPVERLYQTRSALPSPVKSRATTIRQLRSLTVATGLELTIVDPFISQM